MNICITTTSPRHSSSSCQSFLGDTSLIRCALGGPLQQSQAVTTEHLLLPKQPASIPLNSSIWIHFSFPQSSMPGSDCHGCTVTPLSYQILNLKPQCSPLPWPWALPPQNCDLERQNMAHRRVNWPGCQRYSLKDGMCHVIQQG